jgi:hypothetical protein
MMPSPMYSAPGREAAYEEALDQPRDAGAPPSAKRKLAGGDLPADAAGPDHQLPADWPDPRGFVPPPPSPTRPVCKPHYGPIISQVRQYDGADSRFTEALAGYFHFRDDARFGGWQSYLERKDDFYRFCCYLHITEMLAARGGVGETRVSFRWPFGRYVD